MSTKKEIKEPRITKFDYIKRFLSTLVQSVYPDSYRRFSEKRVMEGLGYFIVVLCISLLITLIIFGLKISEIRQDLSGEMEKVEKVEFSFNITEDINFKGLRVAEEGNLSDEKLLITRDGMQRESWLCIISSLCLGDPVTKDFKDSDVLTESLLNFMRISFYFLLPLGAFLYTLYNGFMALILVALVSFFGKLLTRKLKISTRQIFLIAIYASTILVLARPFSLVAPLYNLPLVLFFFLCLVGILLVGERKHKY